MEDSVLITIRTKLGIPPTQDAFDEEILPAINSAFMILNQLNVPADSEPFVVEDDTATWSDFIGTATNLAGVKSYIYLKTKLLFDPPATSFLLAEIEKLIAEFEFRLNVQTDFTPEEEV